MKKLITIVAALLMTVSLWAQAPEKMSYQAVVRNASNNLVANQAVGMRLSILQGSATGTAVYLETQVPTTNANGLVALEIGAGTVLSGNFSIINWAIGPYFIKTETDPVGGTNYTITGTSQLISVPYALHAKTADRVKGISVDKFYLGQDTLGGIVYYIYKNATGIQHGLIVSKTETTSSWDAIGGTTTGANRTDDGAFNTALMPTATGDAANGLSAGWYIPSIDELGLLYYNRFSAQKGLRAIGATALSNLNATYWSSTEYNATYAVYFSFNFGYAYGLYQ